MTKKELSESRKGTVKFFIGFIVVVFFLLIGIEFLQKHLGTLAPMQTLITAGVSLVICAIIGFGVILWANKKWK